MQSAILTYHSIDDSGSVISVGPDAFVAHMEALAAGARPVVPLDRLGDTPGSVAITFDDGFENFHRFALPVLQDLCLPATVFVVSGYAGKRNAWLQPEGIPEAPLMSWEAILECAAAGVQIGCHTATHPHLPELTAEEIDAELRNSKDAIEQRLGRAVNTFAYPYGAVSPVARDCAARHFTLGCGVRLGFVRAGDHPLELPRLDAYYLRDPRRFENFSQGYGSLYIRWRAALRAVAAAVRRA